MKKQNVPKQLNEGKTHDTAILCDYDNVCGRRAEILCDKTNILKPSQSLKKETRMA